MVVESPGWGFVSHTSNVNFDENIAFNVMGASFVTEAGNEMGRFVGWNKSSTPLDHLTEYGYTRILFEIKDNKTLQKGYFARILTYSKSSRKGTIMTK